MHSALVGRWVDRYTEPSLLINFITLMRTLNRVHVDFLSLSGNSGIRRHEGEQQRSYERSREIVIEEREKNRTKKNFIDFPM